MKTNTTNFFHQFSAGLSMFLVMAVFLTATHAYDIVGAPRHTSDSSTASDDTTLRTRAEEPVQKSVSDLHSHVDKTMVKDPGFNKAFGDSSSLTARREREEIEEDQPLSLKMIEMMFMARLTLAYTLAR